MENIRYVTFDKEGNITGMYSAPREGAVKIPLKYTKYSNVIDALKAYKEQLVKDTVQSLVDKIKSKYAQFEVESFLDQREEWRRWISDPNAPTPYVDALAAARGISKEELMKRIGRKVTALATLQGKQQALIDKIEAATTIEELEMIDQELQKLKQVLGNDI